MNRGRLLDPEFVRFVRERRPLVVPFTGAGVSVGAGVPAADKLAVPIADASNERGASVERVEDFAKVCAAITEAIGVDQLKEVVAGVIRGLDVRATPLLKSIVRAPSKIILTSNYDDGLEQAARVAGLSPRTLEPRMAPALGQPAANEVFVIHIHGIATDPRSIIVPGQPLTNLPEDEPFLLGLRALLAPHSLVYLGYRFPPEDAYLRSELEWIASNLRDTRDHALLIPAHEYEPRAEELDALRDANFAIFTFDASRSYDAVQQAALIIAPESPIRTEAVTRRPDRDPTTYFRPPLIVADDPSITRDELQTKIDMARIGYGDLPFFEPAAIEEYGRAIVTGEAGSGKSELMLMLAEGSAAANHLYVRLPDIAATLLEDDLSRAFLRALASAAALTSETQRPTAESIEQNAYVLLLDAFDEVAPENRDALAARLDEIADRWPQHTFIVTTRPIAERDAFSPKWRAYRLFPDPSWGIEYLRDTRGIPQTKIDELFAQFPRASELIAIPLYAALIGERLATDEPLPNSALDLITQVAVRDALAREAEREGLRVADVYRFLKTLGLALELRGLNQAPLSALAELPAPPTLATEGLREHLIQQALLRDRPDVAQFQAVSVQEALAAEAILETDDPVAAVRTLAAADVAGAPVLRRDIDHALDLLFEAASLDIRAHLRELDELRWARTQPTSIDEADAETTLKFLWYFFADRRIWIDSDRSRELRDARAAVERLGEAYPAALLSFRPELLKAVEHDEATVRGNAIFFLSQLETDDERAAWLQPRLTDDNSVVRRWAAEAARRHHVEELRDAVAEAYRVDTDELAAAALGATLLALAPRDERGEAAAQLLSNPIGWSRLSYSVEQLPLADILTLLERGDLRRWEDERLLETTITERPHDEWTEDIVERLIALVVREGARRHIQVRNIAAVEELARRHPTGALRGAAAAATPDTLWIDLWFLHSLPREQLEAACSGELEAPLKAVFERLDLPAPPATATAVEAEHPEQRLVDWIEEGKLDETHCVSHDDLIRKFIDQLDDLSPENRERLTSYVRAWWPTVPLSEAASTDGTSGRHYVCFVAALAFHAALGIPIDRDRWLEIFESNAAWFHRPATGWMMAQYPADDVEGRVTAHIASLTNAYLIGSALECLPELTAAVADAAAHAIAQLPNEEATFLLSRFREADQLTALRYIADNAAAETSRIGARQELAAAGNVDAQREELEKILANLEDGHDFRMSSPEWLPAARAEVLPEIAEVFRALSQRYGPSESDLGRALTSVLERLGDEQGLAIYDGLIADSRSIGGSFYWHQRTALASEIARRHVLRRLPEDLPQVVEVMRELGFDPTGD